MDNVFSSSQIPAIFIKWFEERAQKHEDLESELIEFKRQLYQELTAKSLDTGDNKWSDYIWICLWWEQV